jgi:cyclopropane fatty-acyl-phospholipid synthase-like methyltransferase
VPEAPPGGSPFDAPLSEALAHDLLAALPIAPGHHVLELGCGRGELMLRILEQHPATTGTGVGMSQEALDAGARAAARRGLHGRVEFVLAPPELFADVADVVLCVDASEVFGGIEQALASVRESLAPGGRALFVDCYRATGATDGLPRLEELHEAVLAAGFRIVRVASSFEPGGDDSLGFAWLVLIPA